MKRAKRGLAALIASILLLGMTAQAAVYSYFPDVPADAQYVDAVNELAEIGIFTGDEKGNFNPDNTITRAEFATVIVRLLGEEERAKMITTSSFTDVPATHWACGYVTVAVELGLVSGYGDGKFGPSDTLTYEQAITVLVRTWGFEDEAVVAGGWPDGYIAIAEDLQILTNISFKKDEAIPRKAVALLMYNSL